MSGWQKLTDFLGLRRNTALLLVALVLAGTGERLWLGFVPKYLETLGATVFIIGMFDALQTLLGALYAYPGGWLTDHWGQRRSLLLFSALSLAGYGVVLVWHHWLAVLSGAFLTFAIVIGEFVLASLLNRPAFGVYMQNIGANRAYEPSALAIISFALTWGAMGVIQLLDRFAPKTARRE